MSDGRGLPGLPAEHDSATWTALAALAQGRFAACEAALDRGPAECAATGTDAAPLMFLRARLRRDQGCPAEAEVSARGALAEHPGPVGTALLALILGDLGRDTEALGHLRDLAAADFAAASCEAGWLVTAVSLAELCATTRDERHATDLARRLLNHAGSFAVAPDGSGWAGSVSRALGLLALVVGDTDSAIAHLEAGLEDHLRAGVPVLVAHNRRELAAALRTRHRPGDWTRAFVSLGEAEVIYRRLGIVSAADDAQALLRRSGYDRLRIGETNVLTQHGDNWWFGSNEGAVAVADSAGMADLRTLLSRPGARVHVAVLAGTAVAGCRDRGGIDGPTNVEPFGETLVETEGPGSEMARIQATYTEEKQAEDAKNYFDASMARAEREYLVSQRLARPNLDDLDRARSLVTTRLRLCIDDLERVDQDLGRHLRHSVELGTFCSYQPEDPVPWRVG